MWYWTLRNTEMIKQSYPECLKTGFSIFQIFLENRYFPDFCGWYKAGRPRKSTKSWVLCFDFLLENIMPRLEKNCEKNISWFCKFLAGLKKSLENKKLSGKSITWIARSGTVELDLVTNISFSNARNIYLERCVVVCGFLCLDFCLELLFPAPKNIWKIENCLENSKCTKMSFTKIKNISHHIYGMTR